jgi:hypothetical protein
MRYNLCMRAPLQSRRRQFLAIFAFVCVVFAGATESAHAQDPFSDFFGGIFGGGGSHRARQQDQQYYGARPRVRRIMPHRDYGSPAYWHSRKSKKAKPDESKPAVEASYFVTVLGDSLGQMLADGLDEAFEEKKEIAIQHKGKESSGLVRDDFFDWPKSAQEILASPDKINVAVMMIGSNDRQSIHEGGDSREPLSPRWRELYGARIDAIMSAFRDKKIPLIWVGLPVMKAERYSADMAQLNEMFREHAARNGAVFVDIWEAFGDERNQYQSFGPDVNGRIVKLRSADGIHFTGAGARKLAHFVEGEIKKLFDARPEAGEGEVPPPDGAATGQQPATPAFVSPGAPPSAEAPTLPDRPAIGPAQSLNTPPAETDTELARSGVAIQHADPTAKATRALVDHIYVDGRDPPPRRGRADDFSWPREKKPAASPQ